MTKGDVQAYTPTLVQRFPTFPPTLKKFGSVVPAKEFFANTNTCARTGTFQCTGKTVTLYDKAGQHTHIFSHAMPFPNTGEDAVYIQTWSCDPTVDLKIVRL